MTQELLSDINEKDGDPRKLVFVRHLIQEYPEALRVWHEFGLMQRVPGKEPGTEVRKHNAMEHMMAGAGAVIELGTILSDKGVLDQNDVHEIAEAFMLHDAGKDLESRMVTAAIANEASWEDIIAPLKDIRLDNKQAELDGLREKYQRYFGDGSDKGTRIHVTRNLIAGSISRTRLIHEGIDPKVIEIEEAAEYSACPSMEDIVDNLDKMSGSERKTAIQKLVLHWVDDIMTNSTISTIDERIKTVFQKPANRPLSEAYRNFNAGGESAEEIQIRVGKKIEQTLAKLAGIGNPDELVPTIKGKLQEKISQY